MAAAVSPFQVKITDYLLDRFAEGVHGLSLSHTGDFDASESDRDSPARNMGSRVQEVGSVGADPSDLSPDVGFIVFVHITFRWRCIQVQLAD
jgi:hypothetical protein